MSANTSSSLYNGPSVDHTLNSDSGSFATVIITNFSSYSTSSFASPLMNGTKCIEFWHYMYGAEVNI
jgi:hypothetical protein